MFETVRADYRTYGLALSRVDYDRLSDDVCKDMQTGGGGYFTIGDVSRLSKSGKESLARSMWLVFALSCYPDAYVHSDADMEAIADSMMEHYPEYQRRLQAAGLSLSESAPSATYAGSGSGYSGTGSSGSGYSTMCKDGTMSQSGGKRGACSWHGGVSK